MLVTRSLKYFQAQETYIQDLQTPKGKIPDTGGISVICLYIMQW